MIALRGAVRHVSQKKSADNPSELDIDPKDTKEGDWIWTGHWAFGSLPDEDLPVVPNRKLPLSSRKKKPHAFVYKFHHISNAKEITVPSSLVTSDDDDEDENDDDEKGLEVNNDEVGGPKPGSTETGEPMSLDEGVKKEYDEQGQGEEQNSKQGIPHEKNDSEESKNRAVDEDLPSAIADAEPNNSETAKEGPSEDVNSAKVEVKSETDDLKISDDEEENRSKEQIGPVQDSETNQKHKNADEEVGPNEGNSASMKQDEDKGEMQSSIDGIDSTDNQDKPVGSTFAEADGGEFTDAGLDLSKKCPIAGCWKGYFENVSVSLKGSSPDLRTIRIEHVSNLFMLFVETKRSNDE